MHGKASSDFLNHFGEFTEIQREAIPVIAKGSNCIVIAPTGSGKTEAAILPILDRLSEKDTKNGIMMLYITPLRALNRDMLKRFEVLCKDADLSVSVRHGDTKQSERIKQVKHAPDVLITTPETFQVILSSRSFINALRNVEAVVVDEVHELYSTKRGAQLCVGLERLEYICGRAVQRIGISATIGNPELIRDFISWKKECKVISLAHSKKIDISIELPDIASKIPKEAEERFSLDNDAAARLGRIAELIRNSNSTLIFANTRQIVESLGSKLIYINNIADFGGIGVHHGSLNKEEREQIENKFKEGLLRSVIATSSLELGIDIGSIDLVIQYGSPKQAVRLVQRVGRSGHTEKRMSKGVIIATNIAEVLESVAVCQNMEKGVIEIGKVHENALDVMMNQISGLLFLYGKIKLQFAFEFLKRTYVYRNLDVQSFNEVVGFMKEQRIADVEGDELRAMPKIRLFYYNHVSFIPDSKRFIVKDIYTNRHISSLDENFVTNNVDENSIFITKGMPWKVVSIDEDVITVEPSAEFEAAIPDWTGEDIPVPFSVASNVFKLFSDNTRIPQGLVGVKLNERIASFVEQQNKFFIPNFKHIVVSTGKNQTIVYSPLGTLANDALSKILAHFISAKFGRGIAIRSSPYMIFIGIDTGNDIEKFIHLIGDGSIRELLENSIAESDIFRYKFIAIAKFFGIIDRDAIILKSTMSKLIRVLRESVVYKETMRELLNNYFDMETLSEFVSGIKSGEHTIEYAQDDSPFGDVILNSQYYTKELIMPASPRSVALQSFIEHTLKSKIDFICTYCGFKFSRKLTNIKDLESIECPHCKSVMIVRNDAEREKIIGKRISEKKLSKKEREKFNDIMAEASLLSSYGGRAAIALSVYGIGLKSAARILMMRRRESNEFFFDLVEAQKIFIRTKKYWSP